MMVKTYLGTMLLIAGADKNATTHRKGIVTYWTDEWNGKEDELLKSCTRVHHKARELGATVIYDSIGVGAGCGAKIQ